MAVGCDGQRVCRPKVDVSLPPVAGCSYGAPMGAWGIGEMERRAGGDEDPCGVSTAAGGRSADD